MGPANDTDPRGPMGLREILEGRGGSGREKDAYGTSVLLVKIFEGIVI